MIPRWKKIAEEFEGDVEMIDLLQRFESAKNHM